MSKILFAQPFDFPSFKGEGRRRRFLISRAQFEVGYQVPAGNKFSVLDLNLEIRRSGSVFEAVKAAVRKLNPDLIFLTYPSFSQGEQMRALLRSLKKLGSIPVVMGGGAVSLVEDAPLRWWPESNIACCYCGFGHQIPEIIKCVTAGEVGDVPGVFWNSPGSPRTPNAKEGLIDLYDPEILYSAGNRVDFCDYLNNIRSLGFNPCAILELTRGCLHRCSFCAINRERFGFFSRSPETVFREIEYLARLGIVSFRFADPTFGLEAEKTEELLRAMASLKRLYPRIRFEVTTRASVVSRKKAELFQKAGIARCDLGMETMSQEELRSVRKDIKKGTLEEAVKYLAELGIETKLFHITFPGKLSVPTVRFLLGLSERGVPFVVQSAYLRKTPTSQDEPSFSDQDQKVFCDESDSVEQLMEWMLVNLAFKSTNTFLHEPLLRDQLRYALSHGADLKSLFEVSWRNDRVVLRLKTGLGGRKYVLFPKKRTPFMWCLKVEA